MEIRCPLPPAIPWQIQCSGRAFKVPEYCDLSVGSANPALKDLGSTNCIDDLMSSFSNLAVKVEDGEGPNIDGHGCCCSWPTA